MKSYLVLALVLFAGCASATRIVGGQDTTIEKYPYIVQVDSFSQFSGNWGQSCGANILTRYHLLSAAHCFEGALYAPQYRRIRAGTTFRNSGGVIHYIENAVNHPEYRVAARYDADITVFKLITPLVFNPAIQRGTIIAQGAVIPDNLPVVHAGWGTTTWGGSAAPILQEVQIYTINNKLCAERYYEFNPNNVVTENMICAGLLDVGGRDACQGDSGGPLYYQDIIIGIVSWGHRCANDTLPGISASVASYSDWVQATAK
ncbi:unnamed protein product [Colias eurytheme]|nr:unnamed protein product [Colias eurytheme]